MVLIKQGLFLLLLAILGQLSFSLPLSKNRRGIIINPNNFRSLAPHYHPSTQIGSRSIVFPNIPSGDDLFSIPLASHEELDPDTTIRVTIGMKPPAAGDLSPQDAIYDYPPRDLNTRSSPAIGLKGSNELNAFYIHDPLVYGDTSPCTPADLPDAAEHENNLVPSDTPHASQYTMVFKPFNRYGACTSAQNGGFVNVATFKYFLDLRDGVYLSGISGLNNNESYEFYYFIVEIIG